MVSAALLRDPACGAGQARRRHPDVRCDCHSLRAALARHVESALRTVPSALQAVLLDLPRDLPWPRLLRRPVPGQDPDRCGRWRLRRYGPVAYPDHLLLRALPHRAARSRAGGKAEASAGKHCRVGAAREGSGRIWKLRGEVKVKTTMKTISRAFSLAAVAALGAVLLAGTPASAADDGVAPIDVSGPSRACSVHMTAMLCAVVTRCTRKSAPSVIRWNM